MSLFAFEHVTKRHWDGRRPFTVLDDVSLEVDAGDFVGIWGMPRSGKSTLLRLAAGIELPDEGRILFDDQDVTRLSGDARAELLRANGIGFVTSNRQSGMRRDALDHVALPLLADGLSLRQARQVAREELERMGVLNCAHMLTDRLSLGEALRVGLAAALVHEPRLLLIDEPAVVLSTSERDELYGLITSFGRASTPAVLVASGDMRIVRRARRIMTIGGGVLRSSDKEGEVVPLRPGRVSGGSLG
jgi:predicted ABC-type transport system involved in lysophospholipase L1 biosynthesis ATPase subunit